MHRSVNVEDALFKDNHRWTPVKSEDTSLEAVSRWTRVHRSVRVEDVVSKDNRRVTRVKSENVSMEVMGPSSGSGLSPKEEQQTRGVGAAAPRDHEAAQRRTKHEIDNLLLDNAPLGAYVKHEALEPDDQWAPLRLDTCSESFGQNSSAYYPVDTEARHDENDDEPDAQNEENCSAPSLKDMFEEFLLDVSAEASNRFHFEDHVATQEDLKGKQVKVERNYANSSDFEQKAVGACLKKDLEMPCFSKAGLIQKPTPMQHLADQNQCGFPPREPKPTAASLPRLGEDVEMPDTEEKRVFPTQAPVQYFVDQEPCGSSYDEGTAAATSLVGDVEILHGSNMQLFPKQAPVQHHVSLPARPKKPPIVNPKWVIGSSHLKAISESSVPPKDSLKNEIRGLAKDAPIRSQAHDDVPKSSLLAKAGSLANNSKEKNRTSGVIGMPMERSNPKQALNGFLQRFLQRPLAKGEVEYVTTEKLDGFVSTLLLRCLDVEFTSIVAHAEPKQAENDVASVALAQYADEITALQTKMSMSERQRSNESMDMQKEERSPSTIAKDAPERYSRGDLHLVQGERLASNSCEDTSRGSTSVKGGLAWGKNDVGSYSKGSSKKGGTTTGEQAPDEAQQGDVGSTCTDKKRKCRGSGMQIDTTRPKFALNSFLQRFLQKPMIAGEAEYVTMTHEDGFVCTLILHSLNSEFVSKAYADPKEAEKDAALAALDHYSDEIAALPPTMTMLKKQCARNYMGLRGKERSQMYIAEDARKRYAELTSGMAEGAAA